MESCRNLIPYSQVETQRSRPNVLFVSLRLVWHMGLDEVAARIGSFSVGQKGILNRVHLKAMQKDKVQEKGVSDQSEKARRTFRTGSSCRNLGDRDTEQAQWTQEVQRLQDDHLEQGQSLLLTFTDPQRV